MATPETTLCCARSPLATAACPQVPTAVFCQPPLSTVGLTEEQAVAQLCGDIEVRGALGWRSKLPASPGLGREGSAAVGAPCLGGVGAGRAKRRRQRPRSFHLLALHHCISRQAGPRQLPRSGRLLGVSVDCGVFRIRLILQNPPLAAAPQVYVSKFKPMKNTLSGRDERTFMKMLVHVPTNKVRLPRH